MTTFRTEFAVDGVWYTNALRFEEIPPAMQEAIGRFSRWTMPVAWRVVTDDTPQKQPYGGDSDPTAFKATDATGEVVHAEV